MGTINIERTVYEVAKSAYGVQSTLTVVLKNTIPIPNDFRTSVDFYDGDKKVGHQSKSGIIMPFGDIELTFTLDSTSTKAEIVVGKLFIPFVVEDKKTVYPG